MFVVWNLGVYIFLLGVDPTICQQCHKGRSWWPGEASMRRDLEKFNILLMFRSRVLRMRIW
jgi:hypothetical protein